jgi:hypothetical protein
MGSCAPRSRRRRCCRRIRRRQAARGTGLKQEINELLRAGLAAEAPEPVSWEPPSVAVGRVLLNDQRAWKDLLDDEDDARSRSRDPR